MAISELTLREAAVACWDNAVSLSAEAKLLAQNNYGPRAVALAILGVEEVAKAIGYVVAALTKESRDDLIKKLHDLTYHEVKHLLASSSEYAQIMTQNWTDGVEWQTGFRPSLEQQLVTMFCQLTHAGLGGLLSDRNAAKDFFKVAKSITGSDKGEVLFGPDIKNAALYVDLTEDGQVKTPARVANRTSSEILGLDWFLEEYAPLSRVLKDDAAWIRFERMVRQGPR